MTKKLFFLSSLLFLFGFTQSQTLSETFNNENRSVYWFDIDFEIITDAETGKQHIAMAKEWKDVIQGTPKEFHKILHKNFKAGRFSIGYFNSKTEADEALRIYVKLMNSDVSTNETVESEVFPERVYWFIVHPEHKKDEWYIPRKPAAIAHGTINDFYVYLLDNLQFKVMTIGPFIEGLTAEDSKRIYFLN